MTCNATYFTRDGTPSHRSLPVRQLAVDFSLGDEIVYSSSKQFISVEQLPHPIECDFYHTRPIYNLGEKLDENVEMRVRGCLNRQKEKKKKRR